MTLYTNLRKAQKLWGVVAKVLRQMGDHVKARGILYKAVVQTVLLYGCERWVVIDTMVVMLEGFHRRVACGLETYGTDRETRRQQ